MGTIRVGDAAEALAEWRGRRLRAPEFERRVIDAAGPEQLTLPEGVVGLEVEPDAALAGRVLRQLDDGGARRARQAAPASLADVLRAAGWDAIHGR